ncbi:MAG TPA: hypothetical protein VG889_17195 [Rhizomicrobium sp.]|nr:hypothetical protein [Rhizomicrobium sp.]
MSANAELVNEFGAIIALLSIPYLAWGLVSPRTAMFWSKRAGRLWTVLVAATLFLFGIGMTIYAKDHTPGTLIVMGGILIWEIAFTGRLSARSPAIAARGPAGAMPPPRSLTETEVDAQVAALRTALPDEQKPEFDALYERHKQSGSVLGRDHAALGNLDIARLCARHAARIWTLKNGPLPSLTSALPLAAGERCVWRADGVRLTAERLEIDAGTLYLTTKRLFFVGRRQSVLVDFDDVTTLIVTHRTDIEIDREQGENLVFRSRDVADPFDPNLTGPFETLWGRVRT